MNNVSRHLILVSILFTLASYTSMSQAKPKPINPATLRENMQKAVENGADIYEAAENEKFSSAGNNVSSLTSNLKTLAKKGCGGDAELSQLSTTLPQLKKDLKNNQTPPAIRRNIGMQAGGEIVSKVMASLCWQTYNPNNTVILAKLSNTFNSFARNKTTEISPLLGPVNSIEIENKGNSIFHFKSMILTYIDGSVVTLLGFEVENYQELLIPQGALRTIEIRGGRVEAEFDIVCTGPNFSDCSLQEITSSYIVITGSRR